MAQYDVDIQLAVRNRNALQGLQRELDAISKAVDDINNKSIDVTGKRRQNAIKDLYKNVEAASLKVLEKLDKAATTAHKNQQRTQLKLENDLFNDKLDKINRLADAEIAASKEANEAALKDFDTRLNNRIKRRKTSIFGDATPQQRGGAAVSAGAFPLLFGGGPGMALGGALGGAVTGKTFGPAAIALQVLGGALDQFVNKINDLAGSLKSTESIFSGLEQAGFKVNDVTKEIAASYEKAGLFADAYRLAIDELNRKLGDDGAAKLQAYQDELKRMNNLFEEISSDLIIELLPALTGTARLILGLKNAFDDLAESPLFKALGSVGKFAPFVHPGFLLSALQFKGAQALGEADEDVRISDSVRRKQEAKQAKQITDEINRNKIAGERLMIVNAELELAEKGTNLLDKEVQLSKQKLIDEKYLAAVRGENVTTNEKILAERQKELDTQNLLNAITAAETRELERQERIRDKANKEAEREAKKKQRAIEREEKKKQRAIERATKAVDRELERTDKAFKRASSQLDAITQKHEDKMAFEREYSRLIEEGSTPATAKQAVELKKQLLELDRTYDKLLDVVDAEILRLQTSIDQLKVENGITTEYEKQLEIFKKRKEELEAKKGRAKGAIGKDLAPETGADRIEEEMKRVKGQLNDLLDPANQVILAAQAIGDAFSESFRGLITGSMSAQEALANLFSRTADHFADMAAQMIAKTIQMKILGIALNFFGGPTAGSFSQAPSDAALSAGADAFSQPAVPFTLGFAEGGYVSGPTRALVGEGGQGEYIIPENRMRESMARYSRGARGAAVIPEAGGPGTSGEGGGTAVAAPIDVRYTVERINSVDYVTADQFQRGMQQAASQGAKQGEQQTLKRLQMSGSTRKRLGM